MSVCLKKVTGKQPVDATADDVVNAVALIDHYKIKDNIRKNLLIRLITTAADCDFATLESLMANFSPANKTLLKRIVMSGGLTFWNPKTNEEYRFWD